MQHFDSAQCDTIDILTLRVTLLATVGVITNSNNLINQFVGDDSNKGGKYVLDFTDKKFVIGLLFIYSFLREG